MSSTTDADKPQDAVGCTPAVPQKEHEWLHKLVGDWTYEADCLMGPDQPPMKSSGTHRTTSFGGLWIVGDGEGKMPDGSPAQTRLTLGYDTLNGVFVGSFIGSMMSNQWVYSGKLDASGKILTLDTEGPDFSDPTKTARYQDILEIKSDDHHTLSSRALGPDGQWHGFMTAHYRRKR